MERSLIAKGWVTTGSFIFSTQQHHAYAGTATFPAPISAVLSLWDVFIDTAAWYVQGFPPFHRAFVRLWQSPINRTNANGKEKGLGTLFPVGPLYEKEGAYGGGKNRQEKVGPVDMPFARVG
jgi:hypothetical protein